MGNKATITAPRSMNSRRIRWIVGMMIVGLCLVAIVTSTRWLGLAPATIGPAPRTALSGPDAAFFEYMAPRIDALLAESRRLSDLGARRSRNLIAIQSGQRNVNELLQELDAYGTGGPVPTRFRPFWNRYVEAVAALRDGMTEAGTAFRHFDWELMGRSLARFDAGIKALADAKNILDDAAGLSPSSASRVDRQPVGGLLLH